MNRAINSIRTSINSYCYNTLNFESTNVLWPFCVFVFLRVGAWECVTPTHALDWMKVVTGDGEGSTVIMVVSFVVCRFVQCL